MRPSPTLEREFDAAALAGLRKAVLGFAAALGMSLGRATDVMLAVHELAANAVRHGPGHGRLRMLVTAGTLRCEVSDPGLAGHPGTVTGPPTGRRKPLGLGPAGASAARARLAVMAALAAASSAASAMSS